jgi:hypothetical protein
MQQNLKNVHSFGNGWWGSGHNTQIFCGDASIDGIAKDRCDLRVSHVHTVRKYADDNDAMIFCMLSNTLA